jgi:hypothetical protein
MPKLSEYLGDVIFRDHDFIGTIAFRDDKIALPDGSKMALGIDDGHWVLIYQERAGAHFKVFEYDQLQKQMFVDRKPGDHQDLRRFKQYLKNFYAQAEVDDLVTILPPGGVDNP